MHLTHFLIPFSQQHLFTINKLGEEGYELSKFVLKLFSILVFCVCRCSFTPNVGELVTPEISLFPENDFTASKVEKENVSFASAFAF